jgi:hypothetical protein
MAKPFKKMKATEPTGRLFDLRKSTAPQIGFSSGYGDVAPQFLMVEGVGPRRASQFLLGTPNVGQRGQKWNQRMGIHHDRTVSPTSHTCSL